MRVIRARTMGMCFGVWDALHLTESIGDPASVTIHGELVHNETVLTDLRARGFHISSESQRVPSSTPFVMITAHGVSDSERHRLEATGQRLIDTTCPLVRRVHQAACQMSDDGRHIIVIGRPKHVEVRGIVEDLRSYVIVATPNDVCRYSQRRLGVVCQTTTSPRLVVQVRDAISRRNPHADILFVDTVCQPTRDRQHAVEQLAAQVEAVVVVGGKNSNNTRELVERCQEQGVPVYHVQSKSDLDRDWFIGCHCVGLSAGTSTLDETIDEVYDALCQIPAATSGLDR